MKLKEHNVDSIKSRIWMTIYGEVQASSMQDAVYEYIRGVQWGIGVASLRQDVSTPGLLEVHDIQEISILIIKDIGNGAYKIKALVETEWVSAPKLALRFVEPPLYWEEPIRLMMDSVTTYMPFDARMEYREMDVAPYNKQGRRIGVSRDMEKWAEEQQHIGYICGVERSWSDEGKIQKKKVTPMSDDLIRELNDMELTRQQSELLMYVKGLAVGVCRIIGSPISVPLDDGTAEHIPGLVISSLAGIKSPLEDLNRSDLVFTAKRLGVPHSNKTMEEIAVDIKARLDDATYADVKEFTTNFKLKRRNKR